MITAIEQSCSLDLNVELRQNVEPRQNRKLRNEKFEQMLQEARKKTVAELKAKN